MHFEEKFCGSFPILSPLNVVGFCGSVTPYSKINMLIMSARNHSYNLSLAPIAFENCQN